MRLLMHVALLGTLFVAVTALAAPTIVVGPDASSLEKFAALELQRYIYAASKTFLPLKLVTEVPAGSTALVLGTPQSLPAMGETWPFGLEEPSAEGYLLHTTSANGRLLVVAAPTPKGVQNGVYGLLEEWGFGFYLGEDTLPEGVPALNDVIARGMHLSKSPAFEVRGSLPWYNFFNSPTAWELEDHKAFIDQLAKMRCNFVGFHTYDNEPFAAYSFDGQLVGGEPLVNTSQPTWGTQPMSTDDFLAGTGAFFDSEYFGAKSSQITERVEAIAAAKEVLRESLQYAKDRGLKTCLGFELHGNAFDPEVQNRFEARLKALLEDYPMLDYVWLWEPEAMGVSPGHAPDTRSNWANATDAWAKNFENVPEYDRRAEAARLTAFGFQANQVLKALRPDIQLVMSGWGGDEWLHVTDFYPGMDSLLPEDVVFSALDNINVTPTVSGHYGTLGANRQRWPIVWFEFDGDQWMPQPNLERTAGACRDALAKGCQGLLGIHWRTRAVGTAATYCARFAWDTELTPEAHLKRRATDLFGAKNAATMEGYLQRLEKLGYRWVGGTGQNECAPFSWGVGEPAKQTELATITYELRQRAGQQPPTAAITAIPGTVFREITNISTQITGVLPVNTGFLTEILQATMQAQPKNPLEDQVAYMEYVLLYDHAASFLMPGSGLDEYVADGKSAEALQLVRDSKLSEAVLAYARRITNKGELGVLATINAKAWADVARRAELPEDALADLRAMPESLAKSPVLLVLPDRVIVAGVDAGKLDVVLKARPLGQGRFKESDLTVMGKNTFALQFPEEVAAGPFEYGIEVSGPKRLRLTWPDGFPNKTATGHRYTPAERSLARAPQAAAIEPPTVKAEVMPDLWRVRLTWEPRPGESYSVSRDNTALGSVSMGEFIDSAPPSGALAQYAVEARNLLSGEKASGTVSVAVPELPLPSPPGKVRVDSRAGRVILGWEDNAVNAAQYEVTRYDRSQNVIDAMTVEARFGHYLQASSLATPGEAYTFSVAAVAPDGRVGPASRKTGVVVSGDPLKPVLDLSFQNDQFLQGLAQLGERGLALGGRGWAQLPAQSEWDAMHALSIGVWVKLDDLVGMPVLVCKGAWQQAGYFVQVLNGQVRFYLAGVDTLDAGQVEAGKWQHIAVTYGYGEMCVYLNGSLAGRKNVSGRPKASNTPLLIGRYNAGDEFYFVRGLMDDIRIYDVALTPGEVEQIHQESQRE